MKILVLTPWINYRGAESVVVNYSYFLNKLGNQSKIATLYVSYDKLSANASRVIFILPPKFVSFCFKHSKIFTAIFGPATLFILGLLNASKFELISTFNPPSSVVGCLVAKIFRKKVTWIAQSVYSDTYKGVNSGIFEFIGGILAGSWIDRLSVSGMDGVFAVSKQLSKKIKLLYGRDSRVIYPGIPQTFGDVKDLPNGVKIFRAENKLLLIHVGALHPQKKQGLTLKLVKKLNDKGLNCGVIFIGEGVDKDRLFSEARKSGISDKVYFSDYVSFNKIAAYYKIADLNVLPSVKETFALSVLEALENKKISVLPDDSGVLEVVAPFSIVVKPTLKGFFDGVLKFMNRRKYFSEKAEDGCEFVKTNLSWKNFCEDYLSSTEKFVSPKVSPDVYDKRYFSLHHEKENNELKIERENKILRSIELLSVEKGMKVLDLGCGNGEFAVRLARLGVEVWGVDYSKDSISLSNGRVQGLPKDLSRKLHFSIMDAEKLDFADNFFDGIICVDVFEHIYPNDLLDVVYEMKRVTKNGKRIVVETAPNAYLHKPIAFIGEKILGWNKLESDEYHINIMNYFSFRRFLSKISKNYKIDILDDGPKAFSSRLGGIKNVSLFVKSLAGVFDFLRENWFSKRVINNTFLKIFLNYDIWGVVTVRK